MSYGVFDKYEDKNIMYVKPGITKRALIGSTINDIKEPVEMGREVMI